MKIIYTALFLFIGITLFAQEEIKKPKPFRAGLILGGGFFDYNRTDTRTLKIKEPFEYSLNGGLTGMYDWHFKTPIVSVGHRIDISGSFKRLIETFNHPRDPETIDAESRFIVGQGTFYPLIVKIGLRKAKIYAGGGWYWGKVFSHDFLVSGSTQEDSLTEFHNSIDNGVIAIAGLDLGVLLLEGFAEFGNTELLPGIKQQFIGARLIFTQ